MVLPGHLGGGYLAARAVLALAPAAAATFSPTQTAALLVIGTLFGDGPDLDLIWYSFKHRILKSAEHDNHRDYATHAPVVWLGISLSVVLAGWLFGSLFTQFAGWMIISGSWAHLLLDSIEYGVMWLWPLSHKRFCIRHIEHIIDLEAVEGEEGSIRRYWNFITKKYVHFWSMPLEIVITIVAAVVAVIDAISLFSK